MGGAAIPIISTIGGLIGQNVENKHNQAAASSAQSNAQAQNSAAMRAALANLQNWLGQNPSPASGMSLGMPQSFGGGVTTGGTNPIQGYPQLNQILQGLLQQGGQRSTLPPPVGPRPGPPTPMPHQPPSGPIVRFGPREIL